MLVSVTRMGDSKSVDMRVSGNAVVLRPAVRPREGWAEAFADMHAAKDDRLLIADALDDSAFEWEW